jgi:hypothetical protein
LLRRRDDGEHQIPTFRRHLHTAIVLQIGRHLANIWPPTGKGYKLFRTWEFLSGCFRGCTATVVTRTGVSPV